MVGFGIVNSLVVISSKYGLVKVEEQKQSSVMVKICRYQENGELQLNGPRIIATFEEKRLISLKNLSNAPIVEMLEDNRKSQHRLRYIWKRATITESKHIGVIRIKV